MWQAHAITTRTYTSAPARRARTRTNTHTNARTRGCENARQKQDSDLHAKNKGRHSLCVTPTHTWRSPFAGSDVVFQLAGFGGGSAPRLHGLLKQ